MESLLGTSFGIFLTVTICVMGFAAYVTGQALANTWKPGWHVVVYCVLLGFVDRFLTYALFEGALLSASGYAVDTAVLVFIGLFAYRVKQAGKMVSQYPWMYERAGLFTWRGRKHE